MEWLLLLYIFAACTVAYDEMLASRERKEKDRQMVLNARRIFEDTWSKRMEDRC